jgi:hypothetical protein
VPRIRVDQPFRKPDYADDGEYIWYGPGGKKGDHATQTFERWSGRGGWEVSEFSNVEGYFDTRSGKNPDWDPDKPFLQTTTFVEKKELFEALAAIHVIVTQDQIDDPTEAEDEMLARWATAYGVEKLAYHGGEEDFVDSLP